MSLNDHLLTSEIAEKIIKDSPNIYAQPNDDNNFNPLGDYCEEFWDQDHWDKEDFDRMIKKTVKQHFQNVTVYELEGLYNEDTESFRRSLNKNTGSDGVKASFNDGTVHWIAWFPEQIQEV